MSAEQPALLIVCKDPSPQGGEVMSSGMVQEVSGVSLHERVSVEAHMNKPVSGNGDPGGRGMPSSAGGLPPHALDKLVDSLVLEFLDVDPKDHQATWDEPVPGYGKPARDLCFSRDHARKLWGFLLKKRDPQPLLVVFTDPGDVRARSLAYCYADLQRVGRPGIWAPGDSESKHQGSPPLQYAYDMFKSMRGSVVG